MFLNTVFLDGVCDAGDDLLRKFLVLVVAVNEALNPFMRPEALSCIVYVIFVKIIEVVLIYWLLFCVWKRSVV